MKVLGIDTSSYVNAIGVIDGNKILSDFTFEARTDSLKRIVSHIDFALGKANLTLEDVEGIGVGLGPGSWTGVRIGVTVAKILAYVTKKPVAGVPTLEALAYNARNVTRLICSIINAGRDTVYAALYRPEKGAVTRVSEYYVGDIQKLSEMITEPTTFTGPEAQFYAKLMGPMFESQSINIETMEDIPRGSAVALLAAVRFQNGQTDNALSLEPMYLKESTAKAFVNRYSINARVKGQDLPGVSSGR
jgi:tRNA threonylcarbamoyladenosine biosynthesis protein TsaB